MAYRQIHTQIWRDDWFLELPPNEKLLFIYLFSNDSAHYAGIYKLSPRHIQLETGLNSEDIIKMLNNFESAGKIVYRNGYIWVKNLRKYNASRSPTTKIAIEKHLAGIPDCEIKRAYIAYYLDNIPYPYPIHTILVGDGQEQEHNSNITQNSNTAQVSYPGGGGIYFANQRENW